MNAKQRRKNLRRSGARVLWRIASEGDVCAWCHRRIIAPCAHAYKTTRTPDGGLEVHCLSTEIRYRPRPAAIGALALVHEPS